MRLFQRARARYALSLVLCAVLIGAMAIPAVAAKRDTRPQAAGQAEQAQESNGKKDKSDKKKASQRKAAAQASADDSSKPASQARNASAAGSSNASGKGQSASAAKSSNASEKGRSASAAKSSNASGASKGQAQATPKSEKPAPAKKQESSEAKGAGENSPAGNKGSMKVRPVGTAAHPPRNYAHLPCTVQVDFYGSPHDGATLTAVSHAPTSPTGQTLVTRTMTFSQSSPNPRGNELVGTTTLDFTSAVSGLTYHEQQGYHVKLTAVQDGPQGGDVKHKVFWIDCPPPAVDSAAQEGVSDVTAESVEQNSASTSELESEVKVERDVVAGVEGLTGEEHTEVKGVSVERGEATAAAEGRVLGTSGAVDAAGVVAGRNTRALAATGLGVLTLVLIGLFGLGGGAGILRRFRQR